MICFMLVGLYGRLSGYDIEVFYFLSYGWGVDMYEIGLVRMNQYIDVR